MIIELFGLPGSGKTTFARAWEREGARVVRAPGRWALILYNALFIAENPLRAFRLLAGLFREAPRGAKWLLFVNSFLVHNAKHVIARAVSARGEIALLDQGHFQNVLSVFGKPPSEHTLRAYLPLLPKPDLLVVLDVPKTERETRLASRGKIPRSELGNDAAAAAAFAAETDFPRVMSLIPEFGVYSRRISGTSIPALNDIVTENLTYATAARMPTEKAHGVSIAAMSDAFAAAGKRVLLLLPTRKNPITAEVHQYYDVPESFGVERVSTPDYVGKGRTGALFFFLQRLLFMRRLIVRPPPPGIVYTREPELVWALSGRRITVFEAHRVPRGLAGWLTAFLVRRARLVVCNSRGTEAAMRKLGVTRTVVAPNGFDPARFTGPVRFRSELGLPEGFLALYAGSEERWKGAHVFRDARRFAEGISFAVVGGANEGEEGGVSEIGRVHRADIGEYLRSADALVLPNTRESEESERYTSPIKLFEYLAAGKPIVASSLAPIREILADEDALFVSPGDAEALARALGRLKEDPALHARLARRSLALSASYTWNARAKRILKALSL
ncbi:MAG: glycosyltransferase [Patescibacteria group bacterium]